MKSTNQSMSGHIHILDKNLHFFFFKIKIKTQQNFLKTTNPFLFPQFPN